MALTPPLGEKQEQPSYVWSDWLNLFAVKRAIQSLETGYLEQAADVVDAMGRDDRISGCLLTRTEALPGLPFSMKTGQGRRGKSGGAVAKEAEELFEEMFPDSALVELQRWATMLGIGFAELVWTADETRWMPRLKVWHPRHFYYRFDTHTWWVRTAEATEEIELNNGKWLAYSPYGLERAWMNGKARSLYVPWLVRQFGFRDWARWSEVHGLPIKKLHTPLAAAEADKQKFLRDVAKLGAESAIRLPRAADGTEFDIELLEAMAEGWQGFEKLLDKAETCIAICLLGQNLTTEISKNGSRSAAEVHERIASNILRSDAENLSSCLKTQALEWWALFNFGDKALAPAPCWETDPPADQKAKGEGLKALGDGFTALRLAGAKPDVDDILKTAGVPTTGPAGEPPPQPAAGPSGAPGQPGAPKPTQAPARAARAIYGAGPNPIGYVTAASKPAPDMAGQLYIDEVADGGAGKGTLVLAPDTAALLDAVTHAADYADLKARVVKAYGAMERAELAALMQKAIILAELAGRHTALEML